MSGPDFSHRAMATDYSSRATTHPVSTGEDVGRVIPTGLIEGVSGQLGAMGDIRALGQAAIDRTVRFAKDHGLDVGKGPDLAALLGGPRIGGVGLNNVVSATAGLAAKTLHADPKLARLAMALGNPVSGAANAPSSHDVAAALAHDKPLYQPQTTGGKYVRTALQFLPAAGLPTGARTVAGDIARRTANVLAPAAASETAGQLTAGTPYEPWARAGAGVAAGALTTALTAPTPSTRMLSQASEGITDPQIAQAQALMRDAQSHGVRLTMAEAIQQVSDNGTGMGRLQRVLEGTRVGEQRFSPIMAERPGQVRGAVMNYADTLAPATDQPSMIGAQAQGAAGGALNDVRQQINATAQPHYDALPGQEIPPEQYQALAQDPSYTAALANLRGNPELNGPVAHLPDNSLAVANEVVKRLNTMGEQVRPGPMNPQGDNGLAALRDRAAGMASQVASDASPDFRAARDLVSQGRQALLEPLQRGPLGVVAGTDSVPAQTRALFPSAPLEGAPAETAQAMTMMGGQNPGVPPSLARQHLINALNESTQNLQSGPNQWGGAKYAAALAGNPEQRATLMSGVGAAGGDTDRLASLLDVLDATGKRQAQGSRTAFNEADLRNLGSMGTVGHVADVALNPPGIFHKLGDAFEKFQTNRNASQLADALLADPETAAAALQRARQAAPANLGAIPSLEYLLLSRPSALSGR